MKKPPLARVVLTAGILLALPHNVRAQTSDEEYLQTAQEFLRKGDYERAISMFNRALGGPRKFPTAYNGRGLANQALGKPKEAIADYDKAIELDPKYAEAFFNRGTAKQDSGDIAGSIADLTRTIELDAKYSAAYLERGASLAIKGDWATARKDFSTFCTLDPDNQDYPRFFIWIADRRAGSKDADTDLAAYLDKRKTGKPGDWPSRIGSFLLGKMTEADFLAAATDKDARTDSGQHCEAYYYSGAKRLLASDKAEATDLFKKCLDTKRDSFLEYRFAVAELKALEAPPQK